MCELKVGSKIWWHQRHSRSQNYRDQWNETDIKGQTSRSWITRYGMAPKRGPHYGYAFTTEELNDLVYVNDNAYRISRSLDNCKDASILRQIDALLTAKRG